MTKHNVKKKNEFEIPPPKKRGRSCLSQIEGLGELFVRFYVLAFEIFEKTASLSDFLDQSAATGEIFFMSFQVLGQVFDFGCENGDLDLWGSGIRTVGPKLLNNPLFGL